MNLPRIIPSPVVPLLVTLVIGAAALQGQEDVPAPAQAIMRQALPPELTTLFPIGREFLGVSIPSYREQDLHSVMKAATIVRVDDQFLDLQDLVIYIYNSEGEKETTISMDAAKYDLTIGELTSETPAKVEQPQFTMTGDKMVFDTHTQVSRLVGNVVVTIPDAGDLVTDFGLPATGK